MSDMNDEWDRELPDVYPVALTKREYFAAAALQGLLANPNGLEDENGYAYHAVRMADSLIAVLARGKKS